MIRHILMFGVICLVSACNPTAPPDSTADTDTTPAAPSVPKAIRWHEGSVDSAFVLAKAEHKPLFLYWGAAWCPPCQEIKHTVFTSPAFIALSALFVPVYLDGDTPRAQATGERFGVKGYPTMIVFNADGEEITRIPGGIDVTRYNTVLGLSLNQLRPTRELVRLALTTPESLTKEDFSQLAYYSWSQDFNALPENAPATLLRDIALLAQPVDEVAASRLYLQYLIDAVQKSTTDASLPIDDAMPQLTHILASNELTLACWDYLAYWPETLTALALTTDQVSALRRQWQDQIFRLRHDPSLTTAEQLAGWLPLLYHHFQGTEDPLPDDTTAQLQADLEAAERSTTNPFARISVINQIEYIYTQARMPDKARAITLAEIERSPTPWYFMSTLGSMAEKEGKPDEAIAWFRHAYERSEGTATRFQWGASYVRGLIRLMPEGQDLIFATLDTLFAELANEDDVLTGRNFRVLSTLHEQLEPWKGEATSAEPVARFTARIDSLCGKQAENSIEKENCQQLLHAPASADARSANE